MGLSQKSLDAALRLANELLEEKKLDVPKISLTFGMAELSVAGWHSAERTGALGHMEYSQVQEYSKLYDVRSSLRNSNAGASNE